MIESNFIKKICCFSLVIIGLIGLAVTPCIGSKYPSKPIQVIIPWPPGGAGDTSFRILASDMTNHLGVPVVIKNIPGAGGITGFTAMSRSKPDGYTLGMAYVQAIVAGQILSNAPYDVKKCRGVGNYVLSGKVLGVGKNTPFHSVDDLKLSKKPIRFCLTNFNSNAALSAIWMGRELNIPITFVSGYKGAGPAILGVIKGEGDAALYGGAMHPYFKSGDLRPLLAFSRDRYKEYPDVPTVKEVGMTETELDLTYYHYALWAPPKTPDDKLKVIEQAMFKSLDTKEIRDKLIASSLIVKPMTSKETEKLILNVFDSYLGYKEKIEQYKNKK